MTAAELFRDAFEKSAVAALARLLCEDVVLEMPPAATWFAGRDAVTDFFATRLLTEPGLYRLLPVAANGQQAFAAYRREPDGPYRAHSISVLTMRGGLIARISMFARPDLFDLFSLPGLIASPDRENGPSTRLLPG